MQYCRKSCGKHSVKCLVIPFKFVNSFYEHRHFEEVVNSSNRLQNNLEKRNIIAFNKEK